MQSAQSEDEVQVREVAVDSIDHERSMELSPRETLDGHTVEGYTHTFDQLPPIEVWLVDGEDDYLVGDGLHRLQAAKRLKRDTIRAQVRHGSVAGLVEAAILANLRHGRPWTRPEKRNCIDLWLKLHPERSNRWIAEDLAVSQNTVASRREELESTVQIEQLDRLVGRDGKWRPRQHNALGLPWGQVHHLDVVDGLRQLRAGSIHLIFADPPYNKGVEYGHVREDKREPEDYQRWCWQWLSECERVLVDGGSMYLLQYPEVCVGWVRHLEHLGLTLRRWISWVYGTNIGRSPDNWTRAHRAILFVTKGDYHTFNADADLRPFRNPEDGRIRRLIAEGRRGARPYDWWEFDLVRNATAEKKSWPNQIPLGLVERIVKVSSNPGDIVLDPFIGSGTTAVAAERHRRRWIGFDTSPESAQATEARLADLRGE